MRKIMAIALLALGLLASSLMLTSASASGGDSLRLTAVSNQFQEIDEAPTGESVGDHFAFSDDVYKHDRLVGSLDGICTTTRVSDTAGHQQCVVTLTLPRGQITGQGVIVFDADFDDRFKVAITGGTGRYDDAAGEVRVRFVSDTETSLKVDLED